MLHIHIFIMIHVASTMALVSPYVFFALIISSNKQVACCTTIHIHNIYMHIYIYMYIYACMCACMRGWGA